MIYSGCEIDDGKNMWEMECLNSIRDDHILISCCSTAQLTPKIVGGKEPYIFFLHRFLLDDESAIKKGLENMIENLTALYSDKSKILIPNSVEEFNALYFKIFALI